MNETVNIQVQEDGSRAVVANMNAVADATDKAGDSWAALQKLMAQQTNVLSQLQSSIDRLNNSLNQQASASQKVVQAQNQVTSSTNNVVKAVQAQSETEAQATTRISEMVQASLAQVSANEAAAAASQKAAAASSAQAAATAEGVAAAQASTAAYNAATGAAVKQALQVEALGTAVSGNIKSLDEWRNLEGAVIDAQQRGVISMGEYNTMIRQLDSQLPNLNASINKEQALLQSLTAKYDPLSAKMTKLQADERALNDLRAKGLVTGQAYAKVMEGINSQKILIEDGVDAAGAALNRFGGASSAASREYGVLIGEVARGNWSRLEGSLITLSNQTGLLQKAFTGLGVTLLGATALLVAFGVAALKGAEQQSQLNAALTVTGHTAGVTEDDIYKLSSAITETGKSTQGTTELLQSLVGSGRVTSDTFTDVGRAASNAMKLTGDSIEGVTNQFEKLYDDPLKWADEMDTKFHFLTNDVRDHIKSLEDTGDKYGAAEVAAKAFADNTDSRVKQLTQSMGYLEKSIQGVTNYLGQVKQFWFDIGKDPTPLQQFQAARDKYNEWASEVAAHKINIYDPANNDVLAYGTKLWNQMKDARDKVVGTQQAAQDTEQYDRQRQSVLDASKGIDGINDKTQKQITLQEKLNKLTSEYKNLYFLDPTNKRLQGVSFDNAGNPSGGAYASKVQQLQEEANGKPKKGPSADELIKPWVEYEKSLQNLIGTIDPTVAAEKKLTDAQELLNKAVSLGDLDQNQAAFYFSQYQAQLQDALNPLAAFQKKLDDQITALDTSHQKTDVYNQTEKARQDLLKQGVVLTDDQAQSISNQYEALAKLTAQQQIYQRIQKSVIDQTKSFSDELKVIQDLEAKGPGNGGISQEQGDKYLVKQSPDLFAGTQKALDVQLDQYKEYYAEIDTLRKKQMISDTDAAIMTARVNAMSLNARLASTESFLGTVEQLQTSSNKKVAAIGKAAAIAQATINTYTGATAAYQSAATIPVVGWILAPIAAAAAVVAGIEQVQKIRSTNPGYMTGGYTGDMPVTAVAGVVHGQEWVSNAQTTDRYRPQLEAMHDGTYDSKYAHQMSQPVIVNKEPDQYKFLMVDDQRDIGNYLAGPAGEKIVVTHVRRNQKG